MRQIVNDWISFCEGIESFKDSYFYTLFMDEITIEEIEAIYRYFPNSEKLVSRMKEYLFDEISTVNEIEKIEVVEKLIKLDFVERKPILERLPNLSNFNTNPKFIYSENLEIVSNLILDDIWIQDFHDYLFRQMLITEKKAYELCNVLYGKTYDFDYQLYLFQPLLKTEYKMEYLFKFKRLGGIYAISDNTVYFTFKK